MGFVMQVLCLLVKVGFFTGYWLLQVSAGGETANVTHGKPVRSNATRLASQSDAKGLAPSLSRSTSMVPQPSNLSPLAITSGDIAPPLSPSAPKTMPPRNWDPVLAPEAPVPVASPSRKFLQNPPTVHTLIPRSHHNASVSEAPVSVPVASDQIAPAPRSSRKNPPIVHPVMPDLPPSIFPGPVAPPPYEWPENSIPVQPALPREPPSNQPEPGFSHASVPPPSIRWKRDGMPVVAPPNRVPSKYSPVYTSPVKEPDISPVSTPTPSIHQNKDVTPVAATQNRKPNWHLPVNPSPTKAPSMHEATRQSYNAPRLSPPSSAPIPGFHSPASFPSASFYRHHHHEEKNITSAAPLPYLVLPPSPTGKAPLYSSKPDAKSDQKHQAPSSMSSVSVISPSHSPFSSSTKHIYPAPLVSSASPSRTTKMPFLSPGHSPRNSKPPLLPPIQGLPPPPPNDDCAMLTCTEPLTNTPPGSPCYCVWPMQVGLRLSVALYTFFPLVSELALEIASAVFMKQSQVRIMGANADGQDPEKTIVLTDLVPLGEKFDNTTAYLTYQRFWHKQVDINTSFFGNYDVLYVRYPGLPSSPPSSTYGIDTSDPGSNHGNNARTIKPIGVDVRKKQPKDGLNGSVIAIIVLSASLAVVLCCALAWILLFRHKGGRTYQPETTPIMLSSLAKPSGMAASMKGSGPSSSLSFESSIATYAGSAKVFNLADIERATDYFNPSKVLGEGGFGRVYSGVLEDETKVAVKVLKRDDQQGSREFFAEVEMLSRLHHRNLVKLVGICTEERTRCLIYELISNGSVESHLHGADKETAPLDWNARMKIALGAARGLAYLHEDSSPRVIHRDFKSSNILLEQDFTPKVADFGLARTALDEENKHISTRVMGTFGYVAPEYAMTGHLLVKSDVYSYGVVLLELLTGRKPVDMSQPSGQENLVAWARPLLSNREGLESIIDPSLGPDFPFESIAKVAAIASMCVQPEVSHRPFMGEVVQALKLVYNECDKTKELGSRSCSYEDLSIDFDAGMGTNSRHQEDPLDTQNQSQSRACDYDSMLGFVERGPSMSDLFCTSATFGMHESGSFRRHSSSGPLRTGRIRHFWQRMRKLSGGSVSEHTLMLKLWPGSH